MEVYQAALAGFEVPRREIGASRSAPGSVSAAIAAYYVDSSFRDALAPATQQMRRTILERFRADHADKRLALLQRPHIAKLLGEKKPFAARNWLKTLRGLMQFAVSMGLRSDDPTDGIKPAKAMTTGGFHSWSEEEIAQFEAKHPVGSQARLAMALLLYTAQRRSDIVRIGPQHPQRHDHRARAEDIPHDRQDVIDPDPPGARRVAGRDPDKAPDLRHDKDRRAFHGGRVWQQSTGAVR
jgi:hypothetical protein